MTDDKKVVIALLAGLAAGAALGLLLAPQNGQDMRDKLSDSLANLGDSVKETISEQIDSLVTLFNEKIRDIKAEATADDDEHA